MPTKVATIDAVFTIERIGTVVALPKEDRWAINPKDTIHRGERVQIRTKTGELAFRVVVHVGDTVPERTVG